MGDRALSENCSSVVGRVNFLEVRLSRIRHMHPTMLSPPQVAYLCTFSLLTFRLALSPPLDLFPVFNP